MTRIVAVPGPAAGCCTAAGAVVGSSWFDTGFTWGAVATVGDGGVVVTADATAVAVAGGVAVAVGSAVGLGNTSRSSGIRYDGGRGSRVLGHSCAEERGAGLSR